MPVPDELGWPTALLLGLLVVQVTLSGAVLLRPQRRQASSLAWILVILLLPVIGIALWFLFGEVRMGRARKERHGIIQAELRERMKPFWAQQKEALLTHMDQPLAHLGWAVCRTDPRAGNLVRLVPDSEDVIQGMIDDIDRAQRTVHIVTYIWLEDSAGQSMARAVARAAQRGVACRILADALGARDMLGGKLQALMEAAGAKVVPALEPPFPPVLTGRIDMRNHRKITIVDHESAWVGSQNIADADFAPKRAHAPWIDCMLRMQGPAVVDLEQLFCEDWQLDAGEAIQPAVETPCPAPEGVIAQIMGTGPNSENGALVQILQATIHMAREEVILTTPYFVPDEGTLAALCTAARRGVSVRLILPFSGDSFLVAAASRSFYEPLLDAGVEIHEFVGGLLHAKTMTVDRRLAHVGSANIDRRSFEINFEVSTLVYDSDFASHLRLLQQTYLDRCEPVKAAAWASRSRLRRLGQNAAGILSPLL
ncbi:MAG: cardiolipin synthase [Planctomycetes bacterium]|nr:cardiolipin synthase [Planctomycetota bacterium]